MTEQGRPSASTGEAVEAQRLAGVVLARIASEPADEAAVARDLGAILGSRASADLWRIELSRLVAALVAGGLVERDRTKLHATASGLAATAEFLGLKKGLPATWDITRDTHLVAKALDLASAPASRLKLLRKPDGLRALIVAHHWQLRIKGPPSAPRLRSALAVKALGRAFGNQVGSTIGDKSSLPAKAGRLLAAQLSASGREFSSDARLVAALAAEAVGSRRSDLKSLQLALLRRFLGRAGESDTRRKSRRKLASSPSAPTTARPHSVANTLPTPTPAPAATSPIAREPLPPPAPPPEQLATSHRPSPSAFASAVHTAANETAEGWPGNRKAFISKVWAVIRDRCAAWALTEIEFKCMLAEAHRTGLVALANADLKDKRALKELNDSAVVYKNTVWHYVRATD
jgi:hypothetical protein